MELYMAVAEGYRLTLDVDQSAWGDYDWSIYLALSQESGKGALVASESAYSSAADAAAAGMQALEQYKGKLGWVPFAAHPSQIALAY